jgi:hypothetical protein
MGHVFCFQQLVRIGEVVSINGSNVIVKGGIVSFVEVGVKDHKSGYPHPLTFPVEDRPHCVGNFLVEYIWQIGFKVGNPAHFLACKVATKAGVIIGFSGYSGFAIDYDEGRQSRHQGHWVGSHSYVRLLHHRGRR